MASLPLDEDPEVDPDDGLASPACAPSPADADRRFGALARLYGDDGLRRLRSARVAVVGIGGVGSWAAEACARSGVGTLALIDLDHVAESNINRQVHALDDTLGAAKVRVMEDRIRRINPDCRIEAIEEFVEPDNLGALLSPGRYDFVIDAIDHVRAKTALIAHCCREGIAMVTTGGAGGRTDPTRVRVADLAHTVHEAMLAKVRKTLRTKQGFPRDPRKAFGVPAVFSDQPSDAEAAREGMTGLNCAGYGSSVAVTAVFGFVAAGLVVDRLARGR